ncbi:MAG TPA: hypothetical protein VH092_01795 [Urbifossiella sp.]|nr:hypothetical protein [Urbifossiella sp.]
MALPNFLLTLFAHLQDSRGDHRKSSAMSSVNWYVALGVLSSFGFAYAMKDHEALSTALICIGAGVLVVGGGIAGYFAVRDPDRLQSEEHLTAVRQLDLIAEKGGKIIFNPVDLPAVTSHVRVSLPPTGAAHPAPVTGVSEDA